jgi:hypothetical protein
MNKKRPIPEFVDEEKENYDRGYATTSVIGLFLLIHNLCHRSLFIHPQPLV